ncbi:MAG TPA: MmgE/PrpD family protein [Candidatus Angelobacter sp.]
MTAARKFAEFIVSAAVPEKALIVARNAFLDTTGVALAGSAEPGSRIVQELATSEAAGPCQILGTSLKTGPTWAALANGAAAHALDFDDMCFVSLAHPSAPLVAAALALGDKLGAAGHTLLEAYVVSFEIEAILGRAMNPRHYQQGWHCTSTLGTLGAAATAARILKLDAERSTHCLAIAASKASGLKENFGTMTKPLHVGMAARNGVVAALLAQKGFTANDGALDGPQGFLHAMASEKSDLKPLCQDLGQRWEILETGITVKLYPSCAATHPALDTVIDLRQEHSLTADQIEAVDVQVDSVTPPLLPYERPQTGLEGKFSMNFCMAAALVYGEVTLETFQASQIQNASIQNLLPRITMRVYPDLGKQAPALTQATVTIRLRGGRVLTREANGARGYPNRPATREELEKKFLSCGLRVLTQKRLRAALACLHKLETLPETRQLTELLASD